MNTWFKRLFSAGRGAWTGAWTGACIELVVWTELQGILYGSGEVFVRDFVRNLLWVLYSV